MSKQTKAERMASSAPINQRALLTRKMAADYLSIGLPLFDQYQASGDIKGIPIASGKEKRYRRSDLDDLIEAIADQSTNIDRTKAGIS
jgi:hypothetical protein